MAFTAGGMDAKMVSPLHRHTHFIILKTIHLRIHYYYWMKHMYPLIYYNKKI